MWYFPDVSVQHLRVWCLQGQKRAMNTLDLELELRAAIWVLGFEPTFSVSSLRFLELRSLCWLG